MAALFLVRKAWPLPLLVAVLTVSSLLAFTFLQPPIWVRLALDADLLLGVWRAFQQKPGKSEKSHMEAQ